MAAQPEYIIEMLGITKRFPGIVANDNITLQLRKGEIHALLGENGAGKSTLMSVLFGMYQPEEGIIKKNGEVVKINDPNDATRLGIGMVHQHFKLIDVFTVQEIEELMHTMRGFAEEGKSILFISHKLNEIMEVSDRVTVLRKGKCIGTVNTCDTNKQELSNMMVGRPVQLEIQKAPARPGETVLKVEDLHVRSRVHKKDAVRGVSFQVHAGEIVCIAGIDGNGQTELVYGITGLEKPESGKIRLCGQNIAHASIKARGENMSHIPEDRHKHGLILDFTLEQNMVLQRFNEKQFQHAGFIDRASVRSYAEKLIDKFDVRSGQGPVTVARSMSGGNQQKAIIARELDRGKALVVAVQPTRGLDVGAIEYIHGQLVAERDAGKAILLVSLELEEVMSLSDRILVMYEGEIVGELDPKKTTVQELGLYMAGAKRDGGKEDKA